MGTSTSTWSTKDYMTSKDTTANLCPGVPPAHQAESLLGPRGLECTGQGPRRVGRVLASGEKRLLRATHTRQARISRHQHASGSSRAGHYNVTCRFRLQWERKHDSLSPNIT